MEEEPKTRNFSELATKKWLQIKVIFGEQGWDYVTTQGL